MYNSFSFKPLRKVVFISIWYKIKDQPKFDDKNMMVAMEVYLEKVSFNSTPSLVENLFAMNLALYFSMLGSNHQFPHWSWRNLLDIALHNEVIFLLHGISI